MFELVCIVAYHGHKPGDVIRDPAEIERRLAHHSHHFVKRAATAAPVEVADAPAPPAAPLPEPVE